VLDRLQRTSEQDSCRDHHARRGLAVDHEPGADAERDDLQDLARRACEG
jgi:hypothetical protein